MRDRVGRTAACSGFGGYWESLHKRTHTLTGCLAFPALLSGKLPWTVNARQSTLPDIDGWRLMGEGIESAKTGPV